MAAPSVTYTFTNATAADATEVNQNFTDIINGISDGTKDITVNLFQANGAATFTGNVTLGNSSSDDITFTGRVASDIDPKTAATNTLGDATQTWRALYLDNTTTDSGAIYFDGGSTEFLKGNAAGTDLQVGGFSVLDLTGCVPRYKVSSVSDNTTITDTDGIRTLLVTTGATDKTITLPSVSNNNGRIITIIREDAPTSGLPSVIINDSGATLITRIGNRYDNTYNGQRASITLQSDGTVWKTIATTRDYIYSTSTTAWATAVQNANTISVPPGVWRFELFSYRSAGTADANISVSLSTTSATHNATVGKRTYTHFQGASTVGTTQLVTTEIVTADTTYYHCFNTANITGGSTGNHYILATRIG